MPEPVQAGKGDPRGGPARCQRDPRSRPESQGRARWTGAPEEQVPW